jgi:ankyrin repeat protein
LVGLLQKGASLYARHGSGGPTALHAAAQNGWSEVVKVLIEEGSDLDARVGNGSSALHLAARHGHVDAAKALLDANAPINSRDNWDRTPLHVAKTAAVMQLLLDAGADVEAQTMRASRRFTKPASAARASPPPCWWLLGQTLPPSA